MNVKIGCLLLVALVACPQMVQAQWSASEKGTLLGAVAGGGAGAAIGKKSGNPIVGAVVGGLGGAIVGNVIGDRVEQRRAAETYYQPQYYQPQRTYVQQNPGVTIDQVIHLTRSGVGDDLIISHVQQNGFQQTLTTNDLILLKNQGVSDRVIFALQRPTTYSAPPVYAAPPVRYSPPVTVVEEVRMVPAPYYYARPVAPYGYYYR
jgi:hypothetical protein